MCVSIKQFNSSMKRFSFGICSKTIKSCLQPCTDSSKSHNLNAGNSRSSVGKTLAGLTIGPGSSHAAGGTLFKCSISLILLSLSRYD